MPPSGSGDLSIRRSLSRAVVVSDQHQYVYAQTDYRVNEKLTALFGFNYTNESGFTYNGFEGQESTDRNNFSYLMEIQGGLWNRLFYTLGGGIEDNTVFGVAGTPRASLAYYLVRPGSSGIFSGTRLTFNFAKGIKEPSIYYQDNSLYALLSNTALVPNGPQLIAAIPHSSLPGGELAHL